MDSLNYWKRREEIAKQNYITEEEEYNRNLAQLYNSMLVNIETQINSFYQKYATAEKITMAEAMQKVAQMDVQAFQAKAKQYVQTRDFSKRANQELRLYNATMKINRLELLKANIGLEMIDTFNQMQGQFDTNLLKRAADEFERQAGILGMGVDDAPRLARTIVNASFHNADFSTRIWLYQGQLKNELSSLLSNGIVQGIHSRELAKQLEKKFGASKYNAERLMRTEMARVQIAAQEESYKANGYEQYVFLAIGTACPDCLALNEQHFNVSDMQAGKNAPPIHPNCRCSTAAWMDRAETMKQIKAMSQVRNEAGVFGDGIKRIGNNIVDLEYIKSEKFKSKFTQITNDTSVNDALRKYATAMLTHRNGTDGEDLYIIKDRGKLLIRKTAGKKALSVELTKEETDLVRNNKGLTIGIHNHPTNVMPTGSDFAAAGFRKYDFGIVVTHDGRVFKYSVGNKIFTSGIVDGRIDKYSGKEYGLSLEKAQQKAFEELKKEYGIVCEELK